jgi:DNA-binding NarL/FixJ family response regulator
VRRACAPSTRTLQQGLLHLLVKATSAPRPRERPAPRQIQVRLGPREADELAAAYRVGKTIKELARRFAIHRTTVKATLERSGVWPPGPI